MYSQGIIFIFLLLLTVSCSVIKMGEDILKVDNIEIYESINGYGLHTKAVFDSLNVGSIVLLGENILYDSEKGGIKTGQIEETLNERIPDVKYNGLIVLDWEGEKMKDIFDGVNLNNEAYKNATDLYIQAYNYVKHIRPKAIVGYYGFPIRSYWNRDDDWREKNFKLATFLSNFDALFPSVYDFYQTTEKNRGNDASYFKENVEAAIELGEMHGKDVYVFVWHRYHDSNKEKGLDLIPISEFEEQISDIVASEVDGRKIKGIIWWSSERYFYNIKNTEMKKSNEDFEKETDAYMSQYMNSIIKAIKSQSHGE